MWLLLLPPSLRFFSPYPRCYLKLGDWRTQLDEHHMTSSTIATVLQFFQKSTEYDRSWYEAWHSWAYMNFQALLEQKLLNTASALDSNGNNYCQYVSIAVLNACMPLVIAVLKAVSSPENVALQDSATRSHDPSPTPPHPGGLHYHICLFSSPWVLQIYSTVCGELPAGHFKV